MTLEKNSEKILMSIVSKFQNSKNIIPIFFVLSVKGEARLHRQMHFVHQKTFNM